MSKEIETIYRKAADVLRKRGWRQFSFGSANRGSMCMLGAVHFASRATSTYSYFDVDYLDTLQRVCGTSSISLFNDDHCKTVDDAIAALEIAADIEACL